MRRCYRWLPAAALLVLVSPLSAADKPVKLTKTWEGEQDLKIREKAPKNGYVADKESWEKLWKDFRGEEKMPVVDFTKELVIIACNNDPNSIGIMVSLDEKGDLKVSHISTLVGFVNPTTFKYQFATVKRDGIKTIGGKAIGKDDK
jgi:hypothetical protein